MKFKNRTELNNALYELFRQLPCQGVSTNEQGLILAEVPLDFFDPKKAVLAPSRYPGYKMIQEGFQFGIGVPVYMLTVIDPNQEQFLRNIGFFKNDFL
jgi:hypothetical protein